jgi:predicted metal-binding membrane protein
MLCCLRPEAQTLTGIAPGGVAALRHGVRIGWQCVKCCSSLTAVLLVAGVMDLLAMAVVTAAISAERLTPAGCFAARATGATAIGAGVWQIARAAGGG